MQPCSHAIPYSRRRVLPLNAKVGWERRTIDLSRPFENKRVASIFEVSAAGQCRPVTLSSTVNRIHSSYFFS